MADAIMLIIELIGTVAFAISGAMEAVNKKMDMLGVAILGAATAVGGGIVRDVILGNTPPQAFKEPIYILAAIITSLIVFLPKVRETFHKKQTVFDKLLLVMDSLGLGVFTVVGISVANRISENVFLMVFVGVVTGVGGGVLRDTMSGSTPYIFRKHFYCSASIIGACVTVALLRFQNVLFAMVAGAALIFILRLLAAHFLWELPRA